VTNEVAGTIGLKRPAGVLVNEVYSGGPADKAGLKIGDVIVRVGGHEVADPGALRFRVATLAMNDIVPFEIIRKGQTVGLKIRMAPAPETPPRDTRLVDGANPVAGAEVANMSPALAEEIGAERAAVGVVVLRVRQGSAADRFGFETGDMIREINGRKIDSVQQLLGVVEAKATGWKIAVQRGNRMLSLVVNR